MGGRIHPKDTNKLVSVTSWCSKRTNTVTLPKTKIAPETLGPSKMSFLLGPGLFSGVNSLLVSGRVHPWSLTVRPTPTCWASRSRKKQLGRTPWIALVQLITRKGLDGSGGALMVCKDGWEFTWNPNDLHVWRSTPQNKAFSNQNKGHLGSRWWYPTQEIRGLLRDYGG